MGSPEVVTNADGFYRFPTVPPGEYTLLFRRDGFGPTRQEGIFVGVGFSATVDVNLAVATQELEVTVLRQSTVLDRHSTAIATNFDAKQLADLPGSRSMQAVLAATPAVHLARFEVGGSSGAFRGPYSAYAHCAARRFKITTEFRKDFLTPGRHSSGQRR